MILTEYAVENEIPTIYCFGRDKKGNRTLTKDSEFRPYFYVRREEKEKFSTNDSRIIMIQDVEKKTLEGQLVSKIVCRLPKYVAELRGEAEESFESDILYPTRYTIDKFSEIEPQPLLTIYLDIETNSINFPEVGIANDEITCITCFNDLANKSYTFVWRADQEEKMTNEKKEFPLQDGSMFQYESYVLYFDSEIKMLGKFLKFIKEVDPDIFTGWNVKKFDLPYIINRMRNLGINYLKLSPMDVVVLDEKFKDVIIKGRIVFDMLDAYRKESYGELESYKLDSVAQKELGEKKVQITGGTGKLWLNDLSELVRYNLTDSMLVFRIQNKKKIIESFDEVRRMSKCSFNDVFNNSRIADSYILSYCKEKYVLPTKYKMEKFFYKGGQVLSPKKGLHEWVSVFDFRALYPKIISCLNASPETLTEVSSKKTVNLHIPYLDYSMFYAVDEKGKKKFNEKEWRMADEIFSNLFEKSWNVKEQRFTETIPKEIERYVKFKEVHFSQETKGIIPIILEHMLEERIRMQKERDMFDVNNPEYQRLEFKQYAFKMLMNSFYGVLADRNFRLCKPEIAESITFIGRNAILWCRDKLKEMGYEVVAGDTDSIFWLQSGKVKVSMKGSITSDVLEESMKIQKTIQESFEDFTHIFNINQNYLELGFEKVYGKIFFGSKKGQKKNEPKKGAKKKYSGRLKWYKGKEIDKLQVVGFEAVRSDHSRLSRATQEEVFDMVLMQDKGKDEVIDYLRKVEKDIRSNKYEWEDIGFPTPLNKPVSDYKANIPVVRGVSHSRRYLGLDIRQGEKFYLLYVNRVPNVNDPNFTVLAFRSNQEVPTGTVLDYQAHVEEATRDNVETIFEGLGWDIKELDGQTSIMDY